MKKKENLFITNTQRKENKESETRKRRLRSHSYLDHLLDSYIPYCLISLEDLNEANVQTLKQNLSFVYKVMSEISGRWLVFI